MTTQYLAQKFEAQETILKDEIIHEIKKICEEDKMYDLKLDYLKFKDCFLMCSNGIVFSEDSNGTTSTLNLMDISVNDLISIHGQIETENERSKQNLHNFSKDLVNRTEIHNFIDHYENASFKNMDAIDDNETSDLLEITITFHGKSITLTNQPEIQAHMLEILHAAAKIETGINS